MRKILRNISKKKTAICAATMVAVSSVPCFAETTSSSAIGTLPEGTTDMFSKLATGLVATIGIVALAALAVYAAPQALVVAKKIFKRVSA